MDSRSSDEGEGSEGGTSKPLPPSSEDMGFGSTAKKLQRVTEFAEEVYERLSRLHDQMVDLQQTVDDTNDRVAGLEDELAAQRAILRELAEQEGIDVDTMEAERSPDEPDST